MLFIVFQAPYAPLIAMLPRCDVWALLVLALLVLAARADWVVGAERPDSHDDSSITQRCYRHVLNEREVAEHNQLAEADGYWGFSFPVSGRLDEYGYKRRLLSVRIESVRFGPLGDGHDGCVKLDAANRTHHMKRDHVMFFWNHVCMFTSWAKMPVPCRMQDYQQFGLAADSQLSWGKKPVMQQSGLIYAPQSNVLSMSDLFDTEPFVVAGGQERYFELGIRFQSQSHYVLESLTVQKCLSIYDVVDTALTAQMQAATAQLDAMAKSVASGSVSAASHSWVYGQHRMPVQPLSLTDPLFTQGRLALSAADAAERPVDADGRVVANAPPLVEGQQDVSLHVLRSNTTHHQGGTCSMWLGYMLSGTDQVVRIPHGRYNKFYPKDLNRVYAAPTLFHPGLHANIMHVRWICTQPVGGAFIPFMWRINSKTISVLSDVRMVSLGEMTVSMQTKLLEAQSPYTSVWQFMDWSWLDNNLAPENVVTHRDTLTEQWQKKVYGVHRAHLYTFDVNDLEADYDYDQGELVNTEDVIDDIAQATLRASIVIFLVVAIVTYLAIAILYSGCTAQTVVIIMFLIFAGFVGVEWFLFPVFSRASGQTPLDIKVSEAEQRYQVQYPIIPR